MQLSLQQCRLEVACREEVYSELLLLIFLIPHSSLSDSPFLLSSLALYSPFLFFSLAPFLFFWSPSSGFPFPPLVPLLCLLYISI